MNAERKPKKRKPYRNDGRPVGRPKTFEDRLRNIILALTEEGKTDAQIAKVCHIDVRTLELWRARDASFYRAIKESKNIPNELVVMSLFQRALGYTRVTKEQRVVEGKVIDLESSEQLPPDVAACIFWLKNRQPDKWRDKQDLSITNEDDLLTDDQLRAKIAAMIKARAKPEERAVNEDQKQIEQGAEQAGEDQKA